MAAFDLTTLTVVDSNGHLNVGASSITWTDMDNADTVYTYYDLGADHITGEWTVTWDFELTGLDNSGENVVLMSIGNMPSLPGAATIDQGFILYVIKQFNDIWVRFDKIGVNATGNTYTLLSTSDTGHLWGTLTHNADNSYDLYYHDDAGRTSQVHTASYTADAQGFQHMGFTRSMDTGTDLTTGYIQNVDVVGFTIPAPAGQDQFAFHEPHPVQSGDKFGNVRYTTGGNLWYNVLDCFEKDISWDTINDKTVDTSWDIINDLTEDSSWDILNDKTVDFSWAILAACAASTSWHIFPAIIEYIQQATSRSILSYFKAKRIATNFSVKPIVVGFNVTGEIDDSHKVSHLTWETFDIKQIKTSFAIREPLISNFKAVPVNSNTRRVFP